MGESNKRVRSGLGKLFTSVRAVIQKDFARMATALLDRTLCNPICHWTCYSRSLDKIRTYWLRCCFTSCVSSQCRPLWLGCWGTLACLSNYFVFEQMVRVLFWTRQFRFILRSKPIMSFRWSRTASLTAFAGTRSPLSSIYIRLNDLMRTSRLCAETKATRQLISWLRQIETVLTGSDFEKHATWRFPQTS